MFSVVKYPCEDRVFPDSFLWRTKIRSVFLPSLIDERQELSSRPVIGDDRKDTKKKWSCYKYFVDDTRSLLWVGTLIQILSFVSQGQDFLNYRSSSPTFFYSFITHVKNTGTFRVHPHHQYSYLSSLGISSNSPQNLLHYIESPQDSLCRGYTPFLESPFPSHLRFRFPSCRLPPLSFSTLYRLYFLRSSILSTLFFSDYPDVLGFWNMFRMIPQSEVRLPLYRRDRSQVRDFDGNYPIRRKETGQEFVEETPLRIGRIRSRKTERDFFPFPP